MKWTARVVRYARKLGEVFSEFRLGSFYLFIPLVAGLTKRLSSGLRPFRCILCKVIADD